MVEDSPSFPMIPSHSSLLSVFGLNATSTVWIKLRKMSYSSAFYSDFYKYQFFTLCPRGRQEVWNFESLTRKPSYSSFFSASSTDFKNVFFEKIHWAPCEVVEVKSSFLRSPRPKFGFHLVLTSFHLEFLSFWISRFFDLGDLSVLENGSLKYFENGLKSMQTFQRFMGGMNRWGRSHLNQILSAVSSVIISCFRNSKDS